MTLREALLNAIGESCAVAPPSATQQRNFSTDPTLNALLEAAIRAAGRPNDDPAEWERQILEIPQHLRQDLLDHFMGRPPAIH